MATKKVTTKTLAERGMLVTLGISQWTARKLDRAETRDVNARHSLRVEAARVNKNLLPMALQLEQVHQTTGHIRKDFARRTLPWGIDGVNILKAEAYEEFVSVANQWREDWDAAVNAFLEAYPQLREEAEIMLNSMFNESDYPTVNDLRTRFRFNLRFMPVPDVDDWRIDVGTDERERLVKQLREQLAETEHAAMSVVWKRVYDVVARANERLRDPEAVFKSTLIENAVDLCRLLPSLNLTNDPALEKTRQEIERSLCVHTPDTLRTDPKVRSDTAKKMADIMSKMAGFYQPVAA